MAESYHDTIIATSCAGCGIPLDDYLSSWQESVNLTPDAVFIGRDDFLFGTDIVEADMSFDWCNLDCFGRWLYRAAVHMGTRPRP